MSSYDRIKKILYKITGITLGSGKDIMIDNRVHKLMRDLKFDGDLTELLNKIENGEYHTEFVNAFTTNKTNFFREVFHFEDLKSRVIPQILSTKNELNIYCSASSTGEEPYSIAMTMLQVATELGKRDVRFGLIATDIDTHVLKKAEDGIYSFSSTNNDFPSWIKPSKYFKRRVHDKSNLDFDIKAKDETKRVIKFSQMNLMNESYPFNDAQFDVVFCRNVLIYFTNQDQNKILKKLFKTLKLGGTLYLGHSENPLELTPYIKRVGHNIFIKEKEYI